jgi:anti-sigma factor RsiW
MDHNEALRLRAVEKYVLGELPPSLRDQFEEHFFECQECALDVKTTAGFVDNARAVWRFAA